jgi:hypothetical protein
MVVIAAAYVSGPGNTYFWLLTSVHRTTMFPITAAWLIIAVWAVLALVPMSSPRTRASLPIP